MGILSDSGMSTSDKITLEHVLILSTSAAWEEVIRRAITLWGKSTRDTLGIFRVVGYGLAAYLVLSGASKVIDSLKKDKKDL
jgi:hypothetical protein